MRRARSATQLEECRSTSSYHCLRPSCYMIVYAAPEQTFLAAPQLPIKDMVELLKALKG